MRNEYNLNYLSEAFYEKYPHLEYPEIETKSDRPYIVMLIEIDENTFAIPFRTNLRHNSCYKFKKSTRQTETVTGLDYSKVVIVNDNAYIGESARVNDLEYNELDANFYIIMTQFKKYLSNYYKFLDGKLNIYQAKRYQYTTLKYFHKELHIKSSQ